MLTIISTVPSPTTAMMPMTTRTSTRPKPELCVRLGGEDMSTLSAQRTKIEIEISPIPKMRRLSSDHHRLTHLQAKADFHDGLPDYNSRLFFRPKLSTVQFFAPSPLGC